MFTSLLLVSSLSLLTVYAQPPKYWQLNSYSFNKYIKDFGKSYSTLDEHRSRRSQFEKVLQEILLHNKDLTHSWRKGINHLSDRFPEELSRMNGAMVSKYTKGYKGKSLPIPNDIEQRMANLPKTVDYRYVPGILSAIKDQGNCGSCYGFSAVANIESHYALKTGQLFSLSPEQVISCTPNPKQCGGTGGCQGGTAELIFDYVSTHGITEEYQVPYTSYNGTSYKCMGNKGTRYIYLDGFTYVPSNSQQLLMYALATYGPLAVSVDASNWHSYESGIYQGCGNYKTKPISLDHAVQLVGYGHDTHLGMNYWVIRNSWNPTFGENGYIRLYRPTHEFCGANIHPQNGSACKGDESTQYVCGECGVLFQASFPNIRMSSHN